MTTETSKQRQQASSVPSSLLTRAKNVCVFVVCVVNSGAEEEERDIENLSAPHKLASTHLPCTSPVVRLSVTLFSFFSLLFRYSLWLPVPEIMPSGMITRCCNRLGWMGHLGWSGRCGRRRAGCCSLLLLVSSTKREGILEGAKEWLTDWGRWSTWDGLDVADTDALDVVAWYLLALMLSAESNRRGRKERRTDWGGWASCNSLNHDCNWGVW